MRRWTWGLVAAIVWVSGCEQCETYEPTPSKITMTFVDDATAPVALTLLERIEGDAVTEVPCEADNVCTLELDFTEADLGTTLPLVFVAHHGVDERFEFNFDLKIAEDTREYCGSVNVNLDQTITVPTPASTSGG